MCWDYLKSVRTGIKLAFRVEPTINYSENGIDEIFDLVIDGCTYNIKIKRLKHTFSKSKVEIHVLTMNNVELDLILKFKILPVTSIQGCIVKWNLSSKRLRNNHLLLVDRRVVFYMQQIDQLLHAEPTMQNESITIKTDFNKFLNNFMDFKSFMSFFAFQTGQFTDRLKIGLEIDTKISYNNLFYILYKLKVTEMLVEANQFKVTFLIMPVENARIKLPAQNLVWYCYKFSNNQILFSYTHISMSSILKEYLDFLSKTKITFLNKIKSLFEDNSFK